MRNGKVKITKLSVLDNIERLIDGTNYRVVAYTSPVSLVKSFISVYNEHESIVLREGDTLIKENGVLRKA